MQDLGMFELGRTIHEEMKTEQKGDMFITTSIIKREFDAEEFITICDRTDKGLKQGEEALAKGKKERMELNLILEQAKLIRKKQLVQSKKDRQFEVN